MISCFTGPTDPKIWKTEIKIKLIFAVHIYIFTAADYKFSKILVAFLICREIYVLFFILFTNSPFPCLLIFYFAFLLEFTVFSAILAWILDEILPLFLFFRRPTDPTFWVAWPVKQQINLASPKRRSKCDRNTFLFKFTCGFGEFPYVFSFWSRNGWTFDWQFKYKNKQKHFKCVKKTKVCFEKYSFPRISR